MVAAVAAAAAAEDSSPAIWGFARLKLPDKYTLTSQSSFSIGSVLSRCLKWVRQ